MYTWKRRRCKEKQTADIDKTKERKKGKRGRKRERHIEWRN